MGSIKVAKRGIECLPWAKGPVSQLRLTDKDDEDSSSGNQCRNPSNRLEKFPYCYSESENNTWGQVEVCNIPYCRK